MTSTIYLSTHQPNPGRPCQPCGSDASITIRVADTTHYLCDTCAGPDLSHNAAFNTRVLAVANAFRPKHTEAVTELPVDSEQLRTALPAALRKLGYDQDDIAAAIEDLHVGGV